MFTVWRLLDRRKLSFPNKTLFPSERTYHCPATSDLLPAVVYENGHRFTRFQGRMKKLLGTIDAEQLFHATLEMGEPMAVFVNDRRQEVGCDRAMVCPLRWE